MRRVQLMTIWQMLEQCVSLLDEPFRRSEIVGWFRRHHPEVKEQSLGAHIQGATAGAPGRGPFESRRPLLERIDHGLYRRYSGGLDHAPERAERMAGPQPSTTGTDVVLVGCVKTKTSVPAPARDLYISPLFRRRREWAEASGLPWFVVSARWGLVAPDGLIAPYDLHLADTSRAYRTAWASWVTEQLEATGTTRRGGTVEIHAGSAYVEVLRPALERRGVALVNPVKAHSMGGTLAWYDAQVRWVAPRCRKPASPTSPPPLHGLGMRQTPQSRPTPGRP